MKRIFDLSLGSIVLLILIFPMMLIALMILFTSKGPVLFWSDRVGRNNVIFKMPKFRSMLISTPVLPKHLLKNPSSYLSPIGKFLRRSSLDELPQIFSVLKGDMSFIGPRPIVKSEIKKYGKDFAKVFSIKPGISGLWQVSGRNNLSYDRRIELDIYYAENINFLIDIKIFIKTIIVILFPFGRGAF